VTRRFAVRTVPRFDRLLRQLSGRHPELAALYAKALGLEIPSAVLVQAEEVMP
jgi:hypothetical protein